MTTYLLTGVFRDLFIAPAAVVIEGEAFEQSYKMCDFEEFLFTCGHSEFRLGSYCHFARNDDYHECYGVKVLRKSWRQDGPCQHCVVIAAALEAARQQPTAYPSPR